MINKLCVHRKKWMDNIMHQISQHLARWLYLTGHDAIYIGKITKAKQECNLGKVNNQNFYFIPFRRFIEKLKYKCIMYGIKAVEVDESYTSKICPLCNKEGTRVKRGLFIHEKVFNADCVGAFNILRKFTTISIESKTLFRKLCNPVKFRDIYRFVKHVINVTLESLRKKEIEGSQIWDKPKPRWTTAKLINLFGLSLDDGQRLQIIGGGLPDKIRTYCNLRRDQENSRLFARSDWTKEISNSRLCIKKIYRQ